MKIVRRKKLIFGRGRQYEEGPLTHRRHTNKLNPYDVILFADDPARNEHYGPHVWTLKTELPSIPDYIVQFAMDFYDIDEEEAREEVDPDNIVSSAGAWDSREFVSEVWQQFEPIGFRTYDGAVVLDRDSVELVYHYDDSEEW